MKTIEQIENEIKRMKDGLYELKYTIPAKISDVEKQDEEYKLMSRMMEIGMVTKIEALEWVLK